MQEADLKLFWCRLLGFIVEGGRARDLKFIPEGGAPLVGAACSQKEIEISVKDTGIGISANENG